MRPETPHYAYLLIPILVPFLSAQDWTPTHQIEDNIRATASQKQSSVLSSRGLAAKPQSLVFSSDTILPHLAAGGGWETTIVFVNMSDKEVQYTQSFYDPAGKPWNVTTKALPAGTPTKTSVASGRIGVGGSVHLLLSEPTGPLQTGWSTLNYDSASTRLGGYAVFRQRVQGRPDFEALVPLSSYDDSIFYMPFDNQDGATTAMAILNPATNIATNLEILLVDTGGKTLGSYSMSLAAAAQDSFVLADRFPAARGRLGTVIIEGSTNRLSALGFRFNSGGAFSTIPILNWLGLFD